MRNSYARQRGLPLIVQAAFLLITLMLSLGYASMVSAEEEGAAAETRVSITRKGSGDSRGTDGYASTSTDEFPALEQAGDGSSNQSVDKSQAVDGVRKPTVGGEQQASANGDFWIYSVDVRLFNDNDADGFYHGIDLLFDADTVYAVADVYAVTYLSLEGGPWNEYAVSPDITLFGSTSSDDYVLVTELLTGYPRGSYDLLLELYDADTGEYLASLGPSESSQLADLPLEDANRDVPERPVSITRGGGGASNVAFLIALLGMVLLARQHRRSV